MSAMCYIRNEKGELSGPFPRETVAQMLVAGLLPACCTILSSPEEAANPAAPADAESPRPATPEPVIRDAVAASEPRTRVQLNRLKKQIQQALDSCEEEDGIMIDATVFPLIRQFVEGGGAINELHVKIPDSQTHTDFLHTAAWESDGGSVVKWLIDAGADVNLKDADGWTPLHWARSGEIAGLLIDAGSDVNAQDEDGCTPLGWNWYDDAKQVIRAAGGQES